MWTRYRRSSQVLAMAKVSVAVCMTIKNEVCVLEQLVEDLRNQSIRPDEIVVTDGGSTDGSVERLRGLLDEFGVYKLISMPGANIASGRNRAIAEASAEVILVVDAGLRLPSSWVESLSKAVSRNRVDIAFGYVVSDPKNDFETALAAVTRPLADEIDPNNYPVSGGCSGFRTELFSRYRYPEWLDYGEDMHLYLQWRQDSLKFKHVAGADVRFRPRADPAAFFRQYFNYARGDGEAGMWLVRHGIRFGAYFILVVAIGYFVLGGVWRLIPLSCCLVLGGYYLTNSWRRILVLTSGWPTVRKLRVLCLVPILRLLGDFAKMCGYVNGCLHRRNLQKR